MYSASILSLAALEYLVHLNVVDAPDDLRALAIEVPARLAIERVGASELPHDWHVRSDVSACRALGDAWLARQSAPILAVPSAPVPSEWNYLINLAHPECQGVILVSKRSFHFDPRLLS